MRVNLELKEKEYEQLTDSEKKKQTRLCDSFLSNLFIVINQTHFNNEIMHCRVKWSDRIGSGKHCHKLSDFTIFEDKSFAPVIRLSKNFLLEKDIDKISQSLFYAMIHIWLWVKKKPWGHTKEFYEKTKDFNFGLIKEILTL